MVIWWQKTVYFCRMMDLSLLLFLLCFAALAHGFNDAEGAKKWIKDRPSEAQQVIWQPYGQFTDKEEAIDVDIVPSLQERSLGYSWSSILRTPISGYSRKLLLFNEYLSIMHQPSFMQPASLSPPASTSLSRLAFFSKVIPVLVSLPSTSLSSSKEVNLRIGVDPPSPSHAPSQGPLAAPSNDDHSGSRRSRGGHHQRHRDIPIGYAPGQTPKQINAPSPDHGHLKRPVAINPGHIRIPAAESPMMSVPSPPPNQECGNACTAPYTETPLGSPCGCVLPLKIELELDVALYTLFPQISVFAEKIADATLLSQSQVRIVGANANNQDQAKSIVDIDLVPLGDNFDNVTALLIFQRFWKHEVGLDVTLFGNYKVNFVHYPGLPSSPPQSKGGATGTDGSSGEQPIGVNIERKSGETNKGTIALIALSLVIAVITLLMAMWLMLLKFDNCTKQRPIMLPGNTPAAIKKPGSMLSTDTGSSTTMSFASSAAPYTGSAKTFTLAELERATEKFKPENIVGEGGFGRVYKGILDDGVKVAVKVLTRDDQQGEKEFIAEVEMLSRLHHRNLVKLIGICSEDHYRCLVYELVPSGSVESHLHGPDKERNPLDWDARMRIALGAARGLAYLHEDSNPRVIHRDFKSSNILLEDDFTPKVSDFGLAKAASDEASGHISTRVMGTFGYVAPEYAMTGHLLVKSDVYSYGVVLLELLTGRKPVDMSQPQGRENLVTWARPLLTSKEGLEALVDPSLRGNFPIEGSAKVAAIASMCVQPEVSNRPFMGEVVQALKLVCNDNSEDYAGNGIASANASQTGESPSCENSTTTRSGPFLSVDYESGPFYTGELQKDRPMSASAILSSSGRLMRQLSGSFRRHSTSGTTKERSGLYKGSMSEHAIIPRRFGGGTGFGRDIYGLWS